MKVVEIPGGTASLREPHEVRQRDRKRVVSAGMAASGAFRKIAEQQLSRGELESVDVASLGLTFDEGEAFQTLQKAVIVASLAAWDRPGALPTWETVEDLPADVYRALETATADAAGSILEGVDFSPPDPTGPGFQGSPTRPSDGSEPVSREEPESGSTEGPSSDGTSTPTVVPSPA